MESLKEFAAPGIQMLNTWATQSPWFFWIFVVCALVLVWRYLKALFKIIFFLGLFFSVILAILYFQSHPEKIKGESHAKPILAHEKRA